MFDAVLGETFVTLDDIIGVSYDPWDAINDNLDKEDESEE